ncbi:MAG: hypothetical protein AAF724_15805 [Pseudomonadota bacterium]
MNEFRNGLGRTARIALAALCSMWLAVSGSAGEVEVVGVEAERQSNGTWRFSVTLLHDDEGWDHYADRWDVVGPDGTVYGERVLAHPHVNEQPFTRSLSGVSIPDDVKTVTVRGNDSVHGLGGKEMEVSLED